MTRLFRSPLWLLFMLVSVACAGRANSEQQVQGAPAATRTIPFTQPEEPGAGATTTATQSWDTLPAQPLDSTANPAAIATATATATLTPSPPDSTPVPLSAAGVAECPVSLPNLEESPNDYYLSARSGYGNPARTMFIGLWPGGKVVFHPGGPGTQSPDGSLAMKFWFYRTVPGNVVIGGQRLDAQAPPMPEVVLRGEEDGYGEIGFHPAGLVFPGEGCWRVTARVGDQEMSVVMLVVRFSFAPFRPDWLPAGIIRVDTDLSGYPDTISEVYSKENGEVGQLIIATSRYLLRDLTTLYPNTIMDPIVINGHSGVCVSGMQGEAGAWQYDVDTVAVAWRDDLLAYQYQIQQQGLGLECGDLLRLAGSTLSHADSTVTAAPPIGIRLPSGPPASCPVTQPPDPPFVQSGATNAWHASFPATAMLHGLRVTARGCWEITGEYKGETLSFVVWVP